MLTIKKWWIYAVAGLLLVVAGIAWLLRRGKSSSSSVIASPSQVLEQAAAKHEAVVVQAVEEAAKANQASDAVREQLSEIKREPDRRQRLIRMSKLLKKG